MGTEDAIAIVGAGAVVPGALDTEAFWSNICAKADAAAVVSPARWIAEPAVMLSPTPQPDKAYSDRCCPLPEFTLDPSGLAIGPDRLAALDPLHRAALQAGREALLGDAAPKVNRGATGVVLAAIVLPSDAACAVTRAVFGPLIESSLSGTAPAAGRLSREDCAASRLAGYPAELLGEALGLSGACYTLDAACASSLYAVKLAMDELRAGRADAMLAGGVSRPDSLFTQVGFSQLRALSPSGRCAPFDHRADGLIVGEGAGVVVLKRLADALRDGDRIRGIVRAVGLSNDLGGNLLAPDSAGQLRAMRSAYAAAGWAPPDVDLIECHGAGTPVGDAVELAGLRALWDGFGAQEAACPIGSVKSMIGHLLTAAGAAGLIKLLLAMRQRILPPTLHFDRPPENSPLIGSPFRVQTDAAPWRPRPSGAPRRAALSAFGFGGINAHLLLEEWAPRSAPSRPGPAPAAESDPDGARVPPPVSARKGGELPQPAVAIVGMAACIGRAESLEALSRALAAGEPLRAPRPADRWRGCEPVLAPELIAQDGCFLSELSIAKGEFHIPPLELPDILPQHLLMLKTAAAAMDDARMPRRLEREAMGALIGLDFDFEASNFHLRWYLERMFPQWRRAHLPHLSADEARRLLAALKDAVSPPLTASRTLGALGSMVASRIAREFRFGGISFVVSQAEASGLRALEIAVGALQAGELDAAVVGAVDLCGEARRAALRPARLDGSFPAGVPTGEGAVALVIKRLEDARRDGDRVYAVLGGTGASDAGAPGPPPQAADRNLRVRLLPPLPGSEPERRRELAEVIGDCGAVSGLAGVLAAALAWPRGEGGAAPGLPSAAAGDLAAGGEPMRIPVGGKPLRLPPIPRPKPERSPAGAAAEPAGARGDARAPDADGLLQGLAAASSANAEAHAAFLQLSAELTRTLAAALGLQDRLAAATASETAFDAPIAGPAPTAPLFDREQCLEFARGSAHKVLGAEFAELDAFPARVRLPDEPLMLVDRILEIQGDRGALGPGRIVTEHDVRPGAWYLDGGRAPVCIAVEAGQADLFLCAWLGIDLRVRGRRTYRLLDATVEFHRDLPEPGETVRYAIDIRKFIRQGETVLFLFAFTGTVSDRPLITMTGGCAGFFTAQEMADSGGILPGAEEKRPMAARRPPDGLYRPLPVPPGSYDDGCIEALRRGELEAAFGPDFRGIVIPESLRLPGGRMALIHRVPELDPAGGRYGLGRIRAEADIHPDDWFLTCHFVDDKVMPGTLMYECCAHALRVFLQRLGWICLAPESRYGPVPGRPAALRCRGPVTPQTRRVVYQVDIKELGYGPQPFALADADMFADGRHIVRFTGMSMQLSGTDRGALEAFWEGRRASAGDPLKPSSAPVVCGREQLIEFAVGRPSAAFGERYRPFDAGRFIARLPAPPYLFIDRITRVEPAPWIVKPGGWVHTELDIDAEAWHIAAEGSGFLAYGILLEAALQPCGWLAAYMGSALKSEKPLCFRNLGGHGTVHRPVPADAGTLRARARMTHVAEVADMIIEHFDFEIRSDAGLVYDGSTYFGFFTASALARQEGIRDGARGLFDPGPGAGPRGPEPVLADEPPLHPADAARRPPGASAMPSRALRMIDRIERFLPAAGPHGLGFIAGSKRVDPQEWFFKAHFHQDPVCPGSLGIESFLQLLKFAARERWPHLGATHRFAPAVGGSHRWVYRGQILPANKLVEVEALVTRAAETPGGASLRADGHLKVDGLAIYRMENFGIELVPTGRGLGEQEGK